MRVGQSCEWWWVELRRLSVLVRGEKFLCENFFCVDGEEVHVRLNRLASYFDHTVTRE